MLGEKDLQYIGTVIFLATRGGAITDHDIEQATRVAGIVYKKIFEDSEE